MLIVDCGALTAADYSGARALLSACDDVAAGIAAELIGDEAAGPSGFRKCLTYLANVSEDGPAALGPLLRRCGKATGAAVKEWSLATAVVMVDARVAFADGITPQPQWAVGSLVCFSDVPAALAAASASLYKIRSEAAPPPKMQPELDGTTVAAPLAVDDSEAVSPLNRSPSHEFVAASADAVEGIPLSPLLALRLRARRAAEADTLKPTPVVYAVEPDALKPWQRKAITVGQLALALVLELAGFFRELIGDTDQTAPVLAVDEAPDKWRGSVSALSGAQTRGEHDGGDESDDLRSSGYQYRAASLLPSGSH